MHNSSFESPDTGANGFCLEMSLKHFKGIFLQSKNPLFNTVYVVRVPFLTGIVVYDLMIHITGTNRGRLLLFDAIVHGQISARNYPIKEHVETKLIVKVAHEVIIKTSAVIP